MDDNEVVYATETDIAATALRFSGKTIVGNTLAVPAEANRLTIVSVARISVVVPPKRDVFKLPLELIDVLRSLRLVFGSRYSRSLLP